MKGSLIVAAEITSFHYAILPIIHGFLLTNQKPGSWLWVIFSWIPEPKEYKVVQTIMGLSMTQTVISHCILTPCGKYLSLKKNKSALTWFIIVNPAHLPNERWASTYRLSLLTPCTKYRRLSCTLAEWSSSVHLGREPPPITLCGLHKDWYQL